MHLQQPTLAFTLYYVEQSGKFTNLVFACLLLIPMDCTLLLHQNIQEFSVQLDLY